MPTAPLDGDRLISVGATLTVYGSALLAIRRRSPRRCRWSRRQARERRCLLADQEVGVPAVPLNVTVLVPLVDPKLLPLMVTAVATGPLDGERVVSVGVGAADTVNGQRIAGETADRDDDVAGSRASGMGRRCCSRPTSSAFRRCH